MASQAGERQLTQTFFDALGELFSPQEIAVLRSGTRAHPRVPQGSPEDAGIRAFLEVLMAHYPGSVGLGLAVRAGRTSFRYGLQSLAILQEMQALSFRLLPRRTKMTRALGIFAQALSPALSASVTIVEEAERYLWQSKPAAECPACLNAWILGFVQEGLYWLSNGKYYPIEEVIEKEDPGGGYCLVIPKKALE